MKKEDLKPGLKVRYIGPDSKYGIRTNMTFVLGTWYDPYLLRMIYILDERGEPFVLEEPIIVVKGYILYPHHSPENWELVNEACRYSILGESVS
jgi:hypothetical protein